ncbi:hypothetical protein BGZ80_004620 [Entomortierella chlamydospora]|uniref:Uncharacterized protein n=1 Tax=Entomortierella chlamydospora TaxID=101097 RepID=A0A9P6MMT0_9FUNG|nr:hypothetical protein BGZ80_004620 [Entomortierella chlamydospora]
MSDSTAKRVKVSKPEKKKAQPVSATSTTTDSETSTLIETTDEPLINIPAVKKKKERRVKTEADIAAKQERKRLRKEAEQAKKEAQLAKKGLAAQKVAIQNKTPKWKQFLKNTTEADNAEEFKDTSYKVKGDDGSDDDDESESDSDDGAKNKDDKKRKAEKDAENGVAKTKKTKQEDIAKLTTLDTSVPGKSGISRRVEEVKSDMEIPKDATSLATQQHSAIEDAKKIVDAPEDKEEQEQKEKSETNGEEASQDQEMKDATEEESTIPLSEEEKAAEEAAKQAKIEAKRAAEVKASRALDVLRVLA